jgi:hypothetical protein
MLATMTRYDDFAMLPRNFLAWWIIVLRMHSWYSFWPLLLAPNIPSISCLPLTRASGQDSRFVGAPKKTFLDSHDNQVAVPLTKSLDMESHAFAFPEDAIFQNILSISPSSVQAVETTNDALTRLTVTFATVSDTRLPADIAAVSATRDACHPLVSAISDSLSAVCDSSNVESIAVIMDKPFDGTLYHRSPVTIVNHACQHTPISALRDVSPDLVLTTTTEFSHLDDSVPSIQEKITTLTLSLCLVQEKICTLTHTDFLPFALPCMVLDIFQRWTASSAITACSCMVASNEALSHRIHQLARLVERDKGLTPDHHNKDLKQDQEFSFPTITLLLHTTYLFDDILLLWIDTATTPPVDAFLTSTTHDLSPGLHADYSRFCCILLPIFILILISLSGLLCLYGAISIVRIIRNFHPCHYCCDSHPNYLSIFSLYLLFIQLSTFSLRGRCLFLARLAVR